ncbi:HAD family hydrolase [Haladaptatus pallidirubidus]|uniref:HAD hydrolase-like protein n=1 Tax=Haladaptatus pallidirubidus TaxID=1008152 RepID=A0AAV3UDG1_9EURY|nr:HAD-IA family hydrolase [Haladaptatus pallidirubidus]
MTDDVSAVVYDLDGTLVQLIVNWKAVAQDVTVELERHGVDASDADLWRMLDLADEANVRDEIEAIISQHERDGARRSIRLPHADELLSREIPVGVCSLNCESACHVGLETHGLARHVDAVVGRDSVPTRKPHPEPLKATLRALGVDGAVFIGDSRRDELTAERAGVAFEYV